MQSTRNSTSTPGPEPATKSLPGIANGHMAPASGGTPEVSGGMKPTRAEPLEAVQRQDVFSTRSLSSSRASEKKSAAAVLDALRAVPLEHGKAGATDLSSQPNFPPGDSSATMLRTVKPPGAVGAESDGGNSDSPVRVAERDKTEPLELPIESAKAAIPVASLAIPPPVRSVGVSRPDFVLDHTLKGHSGWVTGVAFSSDGHRLASGSWDQTVKFWDVPTGQEISTIGRKMQEVEAVALSRDGHWLAAENSNNKVTLWDTTTGREAHSLQGNKPVGVLGSNWVYSIAFSPDGRWLASAVDDKTIRLWDVKTGLMVRDFTGLRRSVMYAAFSPDGRWLASGDDDKNIRIWDVPSGREIQRLSGHKKTIYAVTFSLDGHRLASASADKSIKIWDIATGREIRSLMGHEGFVTSLVFSPDGRWLASGSWDKTIKIWDIETGSELQTLSGHGNAVYSVAFDSSGRRLASGSEDGTISLWRLSGFADQTKSQ